MNRIANRRLPITVVIATLGAAELKNTIANINQGDEIPEEILICIPDSEADKTYFSSTFKNVHVIKTSCRGQVAQRAVGLGQVAQPFVLQLDDDVTLFPNTLKALYQKLLTLGPGNVIAPFFRIKPDGDDGTKYLNGWKGFFRDCHASLICGAPFGKKRMGLISSSGIGFGVPMNSGGSRVVESQWLPGGVVMCHKKDLITADYFPFSGKAYSEDLIHSILWRNNGCRLWTYLDASALVDVSTESFVWERVIDRYKSHAYVAKISGGYVWRTRLWLFFYCFSNLTNLLKNNFKKP